jgi:hypothetical protein
VTAGKIVGTVTCSIQNIKVGEVQFRTLNSIYAPVQVESAGLLADNKKAAEDTTDSLTVEAFEQGTEPITAVEDEADSYDPGDMATAEAMSIFNREYLMSLAAPIGLALLMLLISLVAFLFRRKRKNRMEINFDKFKDNGGNFYGYK